MTVMLPALATKLTVAPSTTTLAEFLATAVMVAVVLPSAAMVVEVVLTVMLATVELPHPPDPSPVIWHELPPQAANKAELKANQTIIEILRMSKHPSLTSCRR